MNQKVIESTYVSAHLPDNLTVEEIHLFMRNVSTFTTIYFEEDTFGCIHYERLPNDQNDKDTHSTQ